MTLSQMYQQEVILKSNQKSNNQFKFDPNYSAKRTSFALSNDSLRISQQFKQLHFTNLEQNFLSLYHQSNNIGLAYQVNEQTILKVICLNQINQIRQFIINQEITNIQIIYNSTFPIQLLEQLKQMITGICTYTLKINNDYDWESKISSIEKKQELSYLTSIDNNIQIQLKSAIPILNQDNESIIIEQLINLNQGESQLQINDNLINHLNLMKNNSISIQSLFEKHMNTIQSKSILQQRLKHPINSINQLRSRYDNLNYMSEFLLQPSKAKIIKLCSKVGTFQTIFRSLQTYPDKTDPYQKLYLQIVNLKELILSTQQLVTLEKKQQQLNNNKCQLLMEICQIDIDYLYELIEYIESSLLFNKQTIQLKIEKFPQLEQLYQTQNEINQQVDILNKKHQQELHSIGLYKTIIIEYIDDSFYLQFQFDNELQLETISQTLVGWQFIKINNINIALYKTHYTKQLDLMYPNIEQLIILTQQKILIQIVQHLMNYQQFFIQIDDLIGQLDYYIGLSLSMTSMKLIIPKLNNNDQIKIQQARHLLVESSTSKFEPNNFETTMDDRIFIIVGPNYSGKSIFIRSIGIIVYLAHCGLPIPADNAEICILQSIFTLFASENISSDNLGIAQNELIQLGECLKCGSRSLILMDEVGKNFKYQVGSNLHKTTLEYFLNIQPIQPIVLSATHFEFHDDAISIGEMDVTMESATKLIFNYRIRFSKQRRKNENSYGLEVAYGIHQNEQLYQRGVELFKLLIKHKQLEQV